MDEITYLVLVPIGTSLALIPLRRQRPLYWWLALLGLATAIGATMAAIGAGATGRETAGGLVLFLLPLALMFLVLRAELFARRLYLIPVLGPLVYFVGVGVSLSVVVTLGLLQP